MSEKDHKDKASFLLLELINEGFALNELIGQMLASYSESGAGIEEGISEGAAGLNRFAELCSGSAGEIWSRLLPSGGPFHPGWQVVEYGSKIDIGQMGENIVLPYGLDYHKGENVYHCPKGCEFFLDEHGHQWVKFFPTNGNDAGREHMMKVHHSTDWIVRRT
jgi:hypothetical protein